ncbi:MAG: hypothetical protein Q9208_008193 [Pyrenodesmia sp. 3 TL-2023]
MDDTSDYWPAPTITAPPAASDMQAEGDGFRTSSEDELNRHYSSHYDPVLPGPTCDYFKDEEKPCKSGSLPPFLKPSNPEEILINTIVVELKKNHTVKVNSTPALLKKLSTFDRYPGCGFHLDVVLTPTGAVVLFVQRHLSRKAWEARTFIRQHWQQHCFANGLYHCDAPGCSHKCKRKGDLERHISTSHCLNAKKFPCSYPGCERGGANGFPRKDKLKDHFENVHRGVGIPPKQPRALVPKD